MIDPQTAIEEAHGLWELAVVRLVAFVESGAGEGYINQALREERAAFKVWSDISNRVTNGQEGPK